jgi:hypothetical protein
LEGKPEGKRPLGRPKRGCDINIKMDLKEISCKGVDFTDLPQDMDQWLALLGSQTKIRTQ